MHSFVAITVVNIWSASKKFIKVVLRQERILVLGQLWWKILIQFNCWLLYFGKRMNAFNTPDLDLYIMTLHAVMNMMQDDWFVWCKSDFTQKFNKQRVNNVFNFRHNIVCLILPIKIVPKIAQQNFAQISEQHTVVFNSWTNQRFWSNQMSQWFNDSFIKEVTCFVSEWISGLIELNEPMIHWLIHKGSDLLCFWMNQRFEWIKWANDSMTHS